MSSRLASFRGPSTPSSSPVSKPKAHSSSSHASSPQGSAESPFHRKTRAFLLELRSLTETWDDLVLLDGLTSAKNLVDTRTKLDNELAKIPSDVQPRSYVVGPQIRLMEKYIADLDNLLVKLQKTFRRMNTVVDSLEALLFEAHRVKGWTWCIEEPLWTTWPLEKFATSMPSLLKPYHRSLCTYTQLVTTLRPHSVTFEQSREALAAWTAQQDLDGGVSWEDSWEDLCKVEVERWERGK